MRHVISILIVQFSSLILTPAIAQNSEFRYGLIVKTEYNRLRITHTDNLSEVNFQPGSRIAFGAYTASTFNKHFFLEASVLMSRAKYSVDYARVDATFIDADVRFTQFNLNLNLVLNPRSEKINIFLFGGGQLLYRRWGEERYLNDIIAQTYWPSFRIMTQGGMGLKCTIGKGIYLQPFIGIRYALDQHLVYDTSLNQVFAGVVLCMGIKGKPRNKYKSCPRDF